jgi:hypothetical protein
MIQFYDTYNISDIFIYLTSNQETCKHLKVVYQSWMMCAKYCTNGDINGMNSTVGLKYATRVRSDGEKQFKWAKKLNSEEICEKSREPTRISPPMHNLVHEDLKIFIQELLQQGRIQPWQITVGLCGALSIATSSDAKLRAKSVILHLASHSDFQLSN